VGDLTANLAGELTAELSALCIFLLVSMRTRGMMSLYMMSLQRRSPRLMSGFLFTWLPSAGKDLMLIENFH
jgi:hypothetical protein